MTRRYPLESLRTVRHRQVQERANQVAIEAEQARTAQRQHAEARSAREASGEEHRQVSAQEQQRLERGMSRAIDLQHAADWSRGACDRQALLREAERVAGRSARAKQGAVATARQALGAADADAKVVDTHHQQWTRQLDRSRARADEEAASESWASRNFDRSRTGQRGGMDR